MSRYSTLNWGLGSTWVNRINLRCLSNYTDGYSEKNAGGYDCQADPCVHTGISFLLFRSSPLRASRLIGLFRVLNASCRSANTRNDFVQLCLSNILLHTSEVKVRAAGRNDPAPALARAELERTLTLANRGVITNFDDERGLFWNHVIRSLA
jgi:hypothetical protein